LSAFGFLFSLLPFCTFDMAILLIESPQTLHLRLDCFEAAPLPRQSRAKWRLLVWMQP
jgi:hypothetical protein